VKIEYPKKLSFRCNRCGTCCGDTSQRTRQVLLLKSEAEDIAAFTGKAIAGFAEETKREKTYTYEMKKNQGKCLFLTEKKCSIYESRPLICRFYPFMLETKNDGTHVFAATSECSGISDWNSEDKRRILDETYFRSLLRLAQSRFRFDRAGS
jgi:Fe-S-cluster containining protein